MLRPGAAPIGEQLLTFSLGPPIMACLWWIMSRGWASTVQGGRVSDRTKQRQKLEFWILLAAMYVFGIGLLLYEWLA